MLDYDPANCAIGAAVAIIGERPTFLVLREAFNGVRPFADMPRRTAIPRQALADRAARLARGCLPRQGPHQDDSHAPRARRPPAGASSCRRRSARTAG